MKEIIEKISTVSEAQTAWQVITTVTNVIGTDNSVMEAIEALAAKCDELGIDPSELN